MVFQANYAVLIDTHCHLNDIDAFPDPNAEIQDAIAAGVTKLVVIGTKPTDWESAIALAEKFDCVWAVVGWHPNYTADYSVETLALLKEKLRHPKVVALGEIGLDYHWDYSPKETQKEALDHQLDLALELKMPVVFHARDAYGDLLDILEQRPVLPYLFHCWAGNQEEAQRAVVLGGMFGVDGPVTYPKAESLRETLREIPPDRLLVETDAPYMAPVPYRGKPNKPAYVREVTVGLAKALNITFDECAELTTKNALRFFGFESPPFA